MNAFGMMGMGWMAALGDLRSGYNLVHRKGRRNPSAAHLANGMEPLYNVSCVSSTRTVTAKAIASSKTDL